MSGGGFRDIISKWAQSKVNSDDKHSLFVDKTNYLIDLLKPSIKSCKSILFLRPRRFGKTVVKSMITAFLRPTYEIDKETQKIIPKFGKTSDT
jgi:hypothetical protein